MSRDEDKEREGKKDLYFSVDIETTGLIPIRNSIISLGAALIRENDVVATFSQNIFQQENTVWDAGTKEFWMKLPDAYAATQVNQVDVRRAFLDFGFWVKDLTRSDEFPVFLAYPATFDFTFCSVLGNLYAAETWPFGFAGFCMQAYAAALLNVPFSQARGRDWPKEWSRKTGRHTHIAVEDAIQQAKCFINMRKWQQEKIEKDKQQVVAELVFGEPE